MSFPARAIASANGLNAVKLAHELVSAGQDTLDAMVEGITLVENDPDDLTVGYGGLPNEDGIVELDAAVMHGPSHRAGAVAGVKNVRHVSKLARLVMQQTKHVLLVGEGANAFARAQGFPEENLLTEKARKIWLYWKQTNSDRDDWLAPPIGELDRDVIEFFHLATQDVARFAGSYRRAEALDRPTGTVHGAVMNSAGDISCVTSTSGLAFKMPGRVGDSPIVGAGLYVENAVGSCGSTGRGEENLRNCSSRSAVELMRQGLSPAEAGLEVLKRVVANVREPWLLGPDGLPNFGLKLYLLSKSGEYAGVSIWGPTEYAVADEQGARLEPCQYLYSRPENDA